MAISIMRRACVELYREIINGMNYDELCRWTQEEAYLTAQYDDRPAAPDIWTDKLWQRMKEDAERTGISPVMYFKVIGEVKQDEG